jgi:anthranilate 1,2-dioxygenase large subunit/terephthalate 1,2-dioxygenase oxygenase component alpha subunit
MSADPAVVTLRPALRWPPEGLSRIPVRIYSDPQVYRDEQDLLFRGPTWNYLGLAHEIPDEGDFLTSRIGDTPVVVMRAADGSVRALVNRCAHKGSLICYEPQGHSAHARLVCPYHNWIYDLDGKCLSVAFEKGIQGRGGMPADFDRSQVTLRVLRAEVLHGLVFATFSDSVAPLREYLGPEMLHHVERTLGGRTLKVLARYSHIMPNNWKLYIENSRDTYHPSLLHSFFATFKLNRLSADGGVQHDADSRHHLVFAKRHTDVGSAEYSSGTLRAMKTDYGLEDPSLIDQWIEFPDQITNSIQSLFPGFVLQQILNSIGTRQTHPIGVDKCELIWTLLGFEEDTPEQAEIRLKQSNLVGPHGFVSMEDGAIGGFVQRGVAGDPDIDALVEMGGRGVGTADNRATETSVRGFYKFYRELLHV